jgi:hypothetical protein
MEPITASLHPHAAWPGRLGHKLLNFQGNFICPKLARAVEEAVEPGDAEKLSKPPGTERRFQN